MARIFFHVPGMLFILNVGEDVVERDLCVQNNPSQPIIVSDELATKFQEMLVQNIGQARETKSFQKSMEKVAAVRGRGHEVRSHFGFHLVLHLVFGMTSGTTTSKTVHLRPNAEPGNRDHYLNGEATGLSQSTSPSASVRRPTSMVAPRRSTPGLRHSRHCM